MTGKVVQIKMKTILIMISILGASAFADDLKSTLTTITNRDGIISTEKFMRNGETNLVRKTCMQGGAVQWIFQKVYCRGDLALELWMWKKEYGLTCSAKSIPGLNVGTHFTPEGVLDNVNIMTTNLVTLEHFTVTNCLLYPLSSEQIKTGNEISHDVAELIGSVTNKTPDQFGRDSVELMEKHTKE